MEVETRSEIVFFDTETTVPLRAGQGFCLLEFGAILVCPKKLVELDSYSTLIRPSDLSFISSTSVRCNGITRDAVALAPTFREVADKIYDILHGRIWAGHNIIKFDCARIREAFAGIGRTPPDSKGTIDSLPLLRQKFGKRAGNLKMATLATYFGLGQQKHRCLDDVRMNLEVLKYCATVLFLESSLPDVLSVTSLVTQNSTTRNFIKGNSSTDHTSPIQGFSSDFIQLDSAQFSSPASDNIESSSTSRYKHKAPQTDPFDMETLIDQMKIDMSESDSLVYERNLESGSNTISDGCTSSSGGFLEPDEISISSIVASILPYPRGMEKMQLIHKISPLQICCTKLKIRFGISKKFLDYAGRPRLSIVVDTYPRLCEVLDACDHLAQKSYVESGGISEWRPVVIRKTGFSRSSIRLQIPLTWNGDNDVYSTEICQRDPSGNTQTLIFRQVDAAELDSLFIPGTSVDAYFSMDVYDYQQNAGIRLVAKKLIVHSKQD